MSDPIIITKIGYRLEEAAEYVGMKPTKFLQLVKDKRMPEGTKIDNCRVWDVRDLINSFNNLKGAEGNNPTPRKPRGWDELGHNV